MDAEVHFRGTFQYHGLSPLGPQSPKEGAYLKRTAAKGLGPSHIMLAPTNGCFVGELVKISDPLKFWVSMKGKSSPKVPG